MAYLLTFMSFTGQYFITNLITLKFLSAFERFRIFSTKTRFFAFNIAFFTPPLMTLILTVMFFTDFFATNKTATFRSDIIVIAAFDFKLIFLTETFKKV